MAGRVKKVVAWSCDERPCGRLVVLVAEVALRQATVRGAFDEKLGAHLLYPRHWDQVTATYKVVLAKAQQHPTYLISDNTLGWTVGPNGKSENGLYLSSAEGLRSAIQGEALKGGAAACRIALVGICSHSARVWPLKTHGDLSLIGICRDAVRS